MKIKSASPIGTKRTMDLEVNHPLHQYYCNGILTSNSHSISYTYTSFREYWLKAHYDPEFNVALLNNTPKGKESRGESVISQYITEILKKGYKILPPSVNISEGEFSLKSDTEIVWGLRWVKNLPDNTIDKIIEERDKNGVFSDLDDFFERIGKSHLNKRALDALVWSGALDEYTRSGDPLDRFELHEKVYTEFRKDKKYEEDQPSIKKLIEKEIEYNSISMIELSFFVDLRKELEEATGSEANYLFELDDEGEYFVVGKVGKVEDKKTKTKKDYKRISLRDETKMLRGIFVWPWKCKGWQGIKEGQIIAAKLHNDGKFINLTNYQRADREEEY